MGDGSEYDKIPERVPPHSLPEFTYEEMERGDRIGTGGDADVYRAEFDYNGDSYPIALKEPRFEGTIQKRVVEKFETEAETWSSLADHENIVSVYSWEADPLPWLALEYMDGGTLDKKIGTADVAEALWLGGRIAEGIRYGHRHGVAHLDIKPTNVLLRDTPAKKWEYPKVSDWGLAKMLLEHSNSIEGISPTYAAPEQFDAEEYGGPDDITDIYQLGAVVYALLTGEPPFTGSSTTVMQGVLQEEPDPPSTVNPDVPVAVDEAVLKAIFKEKDGRYESVLLFRKELDRLFKQHVESKGTTKGSTGPGGSESQDTASATRSDKTGEGSAEATTVEEGTRDRAEKGENHLAADLTNQQDSTGGESSVLTRRRVLGILSVGVIGVGGGWMAATQLSGDEEVPWETSDPGGSTSDTDTITDEYRLSQGEMYRYEGEWSGQSATLIWDVISTGTDSIEVQIRSDSGMVATINSTHTDVFGDAIDEVGDIIRTLRVPVDASSGQELSVGESWTASVDEQLLQEGDLVGIEVIGSSTVNGVSCTRVSVDETAGGSGSSIYDACVAPGYPLVLSYNNPSASGYNLDLTDANRP